jgi:hypothetical protein
MAGMNAADSFTMRFGHSLKFHAAGKSIFLDAVIRTVVQVLNGKKITVTPKK